MLTLDHLSPCPVCGAAVASDGPLWIRHHDWHLATGTGIPLSGPQDDAQTLRLPPIGETVRRRPPVPPPATVRELSGSELLRALADEIDHELQEEEAQARFWGDHEDQGDDDGPAAP